MQILSVKSSIMLHKNPVHLEVLFHGRIGWVFKWRFQVKGGDILCPKPLRIIRIYDKENGF